MDTTVWTAEAVEKAVLQDNSNLEIVLCNYFKAFLVRLSEYDINLQEVNSVDMLTQKILDGIEKLEVMVREFISVVEIFATGNHSILTRRLPTFIENLICSYDERGIVLLAGENPDVLRNDHYRFFNQFLFISLTSLLLENKNFETLKAVLHAKFKIYDRAYHILRDVNFIRLYSYNYTLNQHLNTSSPQRVSVTADYVLKYSTPAQFDKLIRADILLYYISLWHHTDGIFDSTWIPELGVYVSDPQILPFMASKAYFEQAKTLFGVETVDEYKELLDITRDTLDRSRFYRVPSVQTGLLSETVGSVE